jgi:hypothetical protein
MKIWQKYWRNYTENTTIERRARLIEAQKWCLIFMLSILPFQTGKTACWSIFNRQLYSFVDLQTTNYTDDYAPYLLGYGVIRNYLHLVQRDAQQEDNIAEWRSRFCQYADTADVRSVLESASIEDLAELRQAATQTLDKDPYYSLRSNTFAQVLQENQCTEVIDYLIFAKNCEPHCVRGQLWAETPRDAAQMIFLIGQGRQAFKNTQSHFIKLRYAYQLVRLAHYAKEYTQVLEIYDDVMPKIRKIQSLMNYWVLAHKAGALQALGKRVEAAHLFAVVFRYAPSKRRQAFESFDLRTEAEWQACLRLCDNDLERASLYAMRASRYNARALDDMQAIYRLEPQSEALDLLLLRETLRIEKVLLAANFRRLRYSPETEQKTAAYLQIFRAFVGKVAQERRRKSADLWHTTEGYLHLLAGDPRRCIATLAEAKKWAKSDTLKQQIATFDMAARVYALSNTSDSMAIEALRASKAYRFDYDFEPYFKEKIGQLLTEQNHVGLGFMCAQQDTNMLIAAYNPQLNMLDDILEVCRRSERTALERELVERGNRTTLEPVVWELRGVFHLSRFEFGAAYSALSMVPENMRGRRFPAFAERLKDCVKCTPSDSILVNRFEYAKRMLDHEVRIRTQVKPEDLAATHFKLGLGYYNITYFSHASPLADVHRNPLNWARINKGSGDGGNLFEEPFLHKINNYEVLNVAKAMYHFEQARIAAHGFNAELAAKAAFWCAKCEQVLYFLSNDNTYKIGTPFMPNPPPQYQRYFQLLKQHYNRTAFYQQARTECRYFDVYARK